MVSESISRLVVMENVSCKLFSNVVGVVLMRFGVVVVKIVFMIEVLVIKFRLCVRFSRLEILFCWLVGICVMIVVLFEVRNS